MEKRSRRRSSSESKRLVFAGSPAAAPFDLGPVPLLLQHPFLGRASGLPVLPSSPLRFVALARRAVALQPFDSIGQPFPRNGAVPRLGPLFLAAHADPARQVREDHAGGHLVHVLPALPPGANETFLKVLRPDAEPLQPLFGRVKPAPHTRQSRSALAKGATLRLRLAIATFPCSSVTAT